MADLLGDDPAAEFLQQEGDQLRELGIDEDQFGEPQMGEDGDTNNMIDEFEIDTSAPAPAATEPVVNGFTEPVSMPMNIQPMEEPESLKKWKEEKEITLKKQEEEEIENHQQWTDRAKKELDDWYNHYNEQLDKTKAENKAAEEQFVEEMTDTKPGNEWEKVSRFCDFNPKNSKNTKDVSRMRGILLQLKQNPIAS